MSGAPADRSAEAGFALLETLVAAAIIAATMGMTYEAVASGARTAREMQDRRQASLVAQSLLAQVGATIALSPGASSGRDGALTWLVEVAPVAGDDAPGAGGPPLMSVRATVGRVGEARPLVALRTLKVGG